MITPSFFLKKYPCAAMIYALVQFIQWCSYTAIFAVLLEGSSHRNFLAPLYVGLLAAFRGVGSLGWIYRKVLERAWLYYGAVIIGLCITPPQILTAAAGTAGPFLVLTGIKLGMLAVFHIWRDVYTMGVNRHGLIGSQTINSLFLTIDFGAMALGVLVGGLVTAAYGPITTLWMDLPLYGGILLLFLVMRQSPYSVESMHETSLSTAASLRSFGVIGHGLRAVSDAGFQGMLPIFAYHVIRLSPAVFGLIVSLSGLLIAVGARLSRLISRDALENKRVYGAYCLFFTIGNAITLWFAFAADSAFWFAVWLGVASLFSGIALVTVRTIVLAKGGSTSDGARVDLSLNFNAIRWFGVAMGGILLSFSLREFAIYPLAKIFLIGMGISGVFCWLHTFQTTKAGHYIGQQIQRLLFATMVVLSAVVCTATYLIFRELPQTQRVHSRHLALLPYITLLEMNLRIADISEAMRLTRKFQYPEGVLQVRIQTADDDQLIFQELFSSRGQLIEERKYRWVQSNANYKLRINDAAFFSSIYEYIYELPVSGPRGQAVAVSIVVDDTVFIRTDLKRCLVVAILSVGFLLLVYLSLKGKVAKLLKPLAEVANHLRHIVNDKHIGNALTACPVALAGQSQEIRNVVHGYNALLERLHVAYERSAEIEAAEKVKEVASQVAHDIRSPLTALNVASMHLEELPEMKRILIRNAVQRINDIANDLAEKKDVSPSIDDGGTGTEATSVQLLSSLIEPLISEKRIQLRSRLGITIQAMLDASSYGVFAKVQPVEFKRVLSNVVNNAVEAMDADGEVTIALELLSQHLILTVSDTGKGIPSEILPKLMQRGATFGKTMGSGLGLYHARSSVETWGGTLNLHSSIGQGTQVAITLPYAEPPPWFVPELRFDVQSTIVIIDDDASIHQIWDERLSSLQKAAQGLTVKHFSSGTDVAIWYQGDPLAFFLCDYELLGEPNNGLDVIQQLGIQDRAVLVTSRFEEVPVQQRCAEMGVRLIPKGLAGFVPISIVSVQEQQCDCVSSLRSPHSDLQDKYPKVLVLDDDDSIRLAWKLDRQRLGIGELTVFASMEECERAQPTYSQFDFAFVDKNIPNTVWRIEQVIVHLKSCGVKRVYIASGENQSDLATDVTLAAADGILSLKIPEALPTM